MNNSEGYTFYTYKLTAKDSDKYYFGVSHIKKPNLSLEECVAHNYWGTGGRKLQNWKAKYRDSLVKSVLAIFNDRALAYAHEAKLVGDLYKIDSNCLNSYPGGVIGPIDLPKTVFTEKICKKHGSTSHKRDKCVRCQLEKTLNEKNCSLENRITVHLGNSCVSCSNSRSIKFDQCEHHGWTKHYGAACAKCRALVSISYKECQNGHGVTKHHGDSCRRCISENIETKKWCDEHKAFTSHQGNCCRSCKKEKSDNLNTCSSCKKTTVHQGATCMSCAATKSMSLRDCSRHGLVKHQGKSCQKCKGDKIRHSKSHKDTKVADCPYC